MAPRALLGLALAAVLAGACAADTSEAGVSAAAERLTVGGCACVSSGTCAQLSYSDVPADGKYVITTFGGGSDTQPMSCGGTADGTWAYVADRARFPCGTKLLVEANGKQCVAQVADCGPNRCVEQAASGSCGTHVPVLDASPLITKHLLGLAQTGWSDGITVTATPVDPNSKVGCPGVAVGVPGSGGGAGAPGSGGTAGGSGAPGSGGSAADAGTGGGSTGGSGAAAGAGGDPGPGKADQGDNGVDGVGSCTAPACDGCATCAEQCACAGTDAAVCADLCSEADAPGGGCEGSCASSCLCQGFSEAECSELCGGSVPEVYVVTEDESSKSSCAASLAGTHRPRAQGAAWIALVVAVGARRAFKRKPRRNSSAGRAKVCHA